MKTIFIKQLFLFSFLFSFFLIKSFREDDTPPAGGIRVNVPTENIRRLVKAAYGDLYFREEPFVVTAEVS